MNLERLILSGTKSNTETSLKCETYHLEYIRTVLICDVIHGHDLMSM